MADSENAYFCVPSLPSQSSQKFGSLSCDEPNPLHTPDTAQYWTDGINPESINSSTVDRFAKYINGELSSQGTFGSQYTFLRNSKPFDSQSESQSSSGSVELIEPSPSQELFGSQDRTIGVQISTLFTSPALVSSQCMPLFDDSSRRSSQADPKFGLLHGQENDSLQHRSQARPATFNDHQHQLQQDSSIDSAIPCAKRKNESPGVSARKKSFCGDFDDEDDTSNEYDIIFDNDDNVDNEVKHRSTSAKSNNDMEELSQKLDLTSMYTPTKLKMFERKMQDNLVSNSAYTSKPNSRSSSRRTTSTSQLYAKAKAHLIPLTVRKKEYTTQQVVNDSPEHVITSSDRTRNQSNSSKSETDEDGVDLTNETKFDHITQRKERNKEAARNYRIRKGEQKALLESNLKEAEAENIRLRHELQLMLSKRSAFMEILVLRKRKDPTIKFEFDPDVELEFNGLLHKWSK